MQNTRCTHQGTLVAGLIAGCRKCFAQQETMAANSAMNRLSYLRIGKGTLLWWTGSVWCARCRKNTCTNAAPPRRTEHAMHTSGDSRCWPKCKAARHT
jgi:hypothetical protein